MSQGQPERAPAGGMTHYQLHQMVYSRTTTTTQEVVLPAADELAAGVEFGSNTQFGQGTLNTNQAGAEAATYNITTSSTTRRKESTMSYAAVDDPQVIMQMQAQAATPVQTGTFGGFAAVAPASGQYNTYGVIPSQQYYYQQQPAGVYDYQYSTQPHNQSSQPAGAYDQYSTRPPGIYDQSSQAAAYHQSSQDAAYTQSRPQADAPRLYDTQAYDPDYASSKAYSRDVYGFSSAEKAVDDPQREAAEKAVHDWRREGRP